MEVIRSDICVMSCLLIISSAKLYIPSPPNGRQSSPVDLACSIVVTWLHVEEAWREGHGKVGGPAPPASPVPGRLLLR